MNMATAAMMPWAQGRSVTLRRAGRSGVWRGVVGRHCILPILPYPRSKAPGPAVHPDTSAESASATLTPGFSVVAMSFLGSKFAQASQVAHAANAPD
jgi:hypothetical protein